MFRKKRWSFKTKKSKWIAVGTKMKTVFVFYETNAQITVHPSYFNHFKEIL